MSVYVYLWICVRVRVGVFMDVFMGVCMGVYMGVYACACMRLGWVLWYFVGVVGDRVEG